MAVPNSARTGQLVGPYTYFHCSSVLDTGGSSSALTHLIAGSSSGGSGAASGWLQAINVNQHGSSGIVTIWDGGNPAMSATPGSSTNPIGVVGLDTQGTAWFNCGFNNFLTCAVASSTAVADVTVTYVVASA